MIRATIRRWGPAATLAIGAALVSGLQPQTSSPLRRELDLSIPTRLGDYPSYDVTLSGEELRVAGVTDYLLRVYAPSASRSSNALSVYIGYYESQTQGRTIHSPKNCLPGSGWEIIRTGRERVGERVVVNRSLVQRGKETALVLYWYQGRGRTQADEYRVKWNLLRDAALRGRSDEALVRIMVPVDGDEARAYALAAEAAHAIVPALNRALPGWRG